MDRARITTWDHVSFEHVEGATELITKLRPTFRMAALSLVVVIGGSLAAYLIATAILWIVFTMFGS